MSRINIPLRAPSVPGSVALGDLAIAAGFAGRCVTLCYPDYPAPLLCQLWRRHARYFTSDRVFQIYSQRDVQAFLERISSVRLLLLYAPRLHNAVAWSIHMAALGAGGALETRPAVFARSVPNDVDEDPGATLVLRGNPGEYQAIARWLGEGGCGGPRWSTIRSCVAVEFDPALAAVLALDCVADGMGLRRIRGRQILQGLVSGACVLRSSRQAERPRTPLVATLEDYARVRRLLQSQIVCPVDEPQDRLAMDMVARANVYLAVKQSPDETGRNPFYSDDAQYQYGEPGVYAKRDLITRREVADLGNVRSGTVRRLIEYLRRMTDGYDLFRKMGFIRRPPGADSWQSVPADSLALALRPWSMKQVRGHFDRLRRDGFLTAERPHRNGPWRYVLPEELASSSSTFHSLPSVQELTPQEEPT